MSLIAVHELLAAGTAPTFDPAAVGDTAPVGDRLYLVVRNGDAVAHTVTLATPGSLPTGDAYPDRTYNVAAGGEAWIPLLAVYRDRVDGTAHITYDATTSVTRAVIRT